MELKRLPRSGIPVTVEWFYDEEDIDMKEAGCRYCLISPKWILHISQNP